MSVSDEIRSLFANVERGPEDMHYFQNDGVKFLYENPYSALLVDMGIGKTVMSLTLAGRLVLEDIGTKILIIGPIKVIQDTWPTEISLWRHTAWLSHTVLRVPDDDPTVARAIERARNWLRLEGASPKGAGKVAQRVGTLTGHEVLAKLARSPQSIHLINRENVEWLVNFWREKWPYRTVIIDESSSFKDHTTDRFKSLAKVRNTPGLIERLHLLTATPAAETYEHLFAQMFLLDRGERLGKNITAYRTLHFRYNKYSMKYSLMPGHEEQVLDKIKDVCMIMRKKDFLPRDEPTVIKRIVKLNDAEKKMLKQLEREFIVNLPDGTELEAKTAAMLASMLLQMASGTLYETLVLEDEESGEFVKERKVHNIHDHKIEALKEIAEAAAEQGENLLVAYYFKPSLAKLQKAFPKAVTLSKDGREIKAWNAGKIKMMFIHPMSSGHGLNLQHGGSHLWFYDLIYSLENYLQIIGRIDRQGQKNPVVIGMLVAEGSRDTKVADALAQKNDAQEGLFKILQRLIAAYRREKRKEVVDF